MAAHLPNSVQVHKLMEGSFLFCSPRGNILLGCPPEILKRILAAHLPMPDTVLVAGNLHHGHSSQASLEFPLYHFLFVQRGLERGHQFQVVATQSQCKGLEEMLRVTVVGPTEKEMATAGTPKGLAKEIAQETTFLALKNPKTSKVFRIAEMINFRPLDEGKRVELYPAEDRMAAIQAERTGSENFRILYGEDAYDFNLTVGREQTPVYKVKHRAMDRSPNQFKLTVLGRSNGFDPNDPANGYLINIDGKLVLWDCPAYMHQHLKQMRVDPKEIDALVLSHVHEDHIDTSESLRDPPFTLYTTPEIYYSLLVKLIAVFGCSVEEAKKLHKWKPINVNAPMNICGATFNFFHSVHAIPALGCRIVKKNGKHKGTLHISGDHLSNDLLKNMLNGGGISQRRFNHVTGLFDGTEDLVLVDVGGGAIHGDYRDYLDFDGRVAYMHTGLLMENLPKDKHLVESGEVLNISS